MNYEYGEGPWTGEPDRVEFESHGLPCIIKRGPLGNLCGYVAVPPGHPFHGKHHRALYGISAHGGVNYSDTCSRDVCHKPKPGEPADVWWFGFDCGHCWDLIPWMVARLDEIRNEENEVVFVSSPLAPSEMRVFPTEEYRDINYVRRECEDLAEQLAAVQ